MTEENKELAFSLLSDSQLAAFVKADKDFAFEEMTRRYKNLISVIASQFCSSEYELCDFTQEGLLGLLSACKTFDEKGGASFKNYAALCIKRRLLSIIRKSKSKGAIPNDSLVSLDNIELSDENLLNPEEIIVSKERLNDLLTQMKDVLSQKEINVIYFYLKGQTYEEISKNTGLSKKSIDNALQRIKKKFREWFSWFNMSWKD